MLWQTLKVIWMQTDAAASGNVLPAPDLAIAWLARHGQLGGIEVRSRRWGSKVASITVTQRIDEQAESLSGLAPTWVVQVIARKWRAPVVQNTNQDPVFYVRSHLLFRKVREALT